MHQISLPASDKSTSTHLCFVSVSHFGNSHNISDFFYYYSICDGDLSSVIIDVTIVIIWGQHKEHPFKTANLIDKDVCSNCPPVSFLHLSLPYSLRLNNIEIRPINNTTVTSLVVSHFKSKARND